MDNRTVAKILFITFWAIFFQCQTASLAAKSNFLQASQSQSSKPGLCKKKLLTDQQVPLSISVKKSDQKQPRLPVDLDSLDQILRFLSADLVTSKVRQYANETTAAHWSVLLRRANPNKAPPVSPIV